MAEKAYSAVNSLEKRILIFKGDRVPLATKVPVADFTHNSRGTACGSETVQFTNASTNGEKYVWDFGDGSTSEAKNPSHQFSADFGGGVRVFNVTLKVTDEAGETTEISKSITIKRLPQVLLSDVDLFNPFSNCHRNPSRLNPNYTITLDNISPDKENISSYTIDWKDGSVQTGLTNASFPITHTYKELGAFRMTITAIGDNGCESTKSYIIANQTNPAGGLGTLGGTTLLCAPDSIPFVISNWQNNSPGTVYILNFGDGTSETFSHPLNTTGEDFKVNHVYTKPSCPEKTFTAVLIVRNACEETPYTAGNIQVNIPPKTDFIASAKNICSGGSVKFTNKTAKGSWGCSSATEYDWDFGDGTKSSAEHPTHTYTKPGTFLVKLTSTNPCSTSIKTEEICVNPVPTANFKLSQSSGCGPFTVKTQNNSSTPNCGTNTYKWTVTNISGTACDISSALPSFINSTDSTSKEPEFKFDKPGTYRIILSTTNGDESCLTVSSAQDVIVKSPPTGSINLASTSICEGQAINPTAIFENCYASDQVTYLWEFPGSVTPTSTAAAPKNVLYSVKGDYTITLKLTNECGTTVITKPIKVNETAVGGETLGAITTCGPAPVGSVSLTNQIGAVARWEKSADGVNWTNLPSTSTTYNYGILYATTYFRALVVTGQCGEAYSTISMITIKTLPSKPATDAIINYCLYDNATSLRAVGANLKWYKNSISASNLLTSEPTPNTSVAGTTKYYVTQSVDGCESLPTEITVTVNPAITNNTISGDQTICVNSRPTTLKQIGTPLSGGKGTYVYVWQVSDDGVNFANITNETNASYSPPTLDEGKYYRRIVESGACESISNRIQIKVQAALTNTNILGNQTVCFGSAPSQIVGEIPVGGDGVFSYVWEKSIAVTGVFTIIPNAITANYQPPALNQTTYYRRSVSSGSCASISSVVTIKVNQIPVLAQLPNLAFCSDQSVPFTTIEADLRGNNIAFGWTNSNVEIGLPAGGMGNVSAFTTRNVSKRPITATITYFATNTDSEVSCKSSDKQFSITVLPHIAVVSELPDLTVCEGAIVAATSINTDAEPFDGASVSYIWTSSRSIGLVDGSGTNIPMFTAVNDTDAPIVSIVKVIPQYKYNGKTCDGETKTYKVTVNPSPKVKFSIANQIVCSKATTAEVKLSSTTANVSYKWTAANVAGITGLKTEGNDVIPAQILVNNTNLPLTVTYKAVAITNGDATCGGVETTYKITVNPTPVLTVSSQAKTICSATKPNITVSSNVEGTTFQWTVSDNDDVTGAVNGAGNVIDQVLVNNSTVSQEIIYTITAKYANSGVICSGPPVKVTITVSPAPKVVFSTADTEICSGQTTIPVELTSLTANAKISWKVTVPAGISGFSNFSGTHSINAETLTNTTNLPLTVIYKAVAKTDDATVCEGEVATYKVTVNPIAKLTNASLTQEICSGSPSAKVVLLSNVDVATFTWVAASSSPNVTGFAVTGSGDIPAQHFVNSGATIEKITFTITTRGYDCVGTKSEYEFTVLPTPIFTSSLASSEMCSGSLFSYVPSSNSVNVNFIWKRASVSGISNTPTSGSGAVKEILVNTTINPIKVTYEYEMMINGCSNGVKYPLVVQVNPPATAKFGLLQSNGCSPFNVVIKNLNSRALSSTYLVDFGDGSPTVVYNDTRDILHTYENDTKFAKLFYVTITTKNACGESISLPYEIFVQPQSVFSKLVLNASQSFGCAPLTVDFTNTNQSTGANLYTWYFGDGSPVQQTNKVDEKLTHTFAKPGDYIVTLVATNGCSTVSTTEVITVYPEVSASFTIDKTQDCVGSAVQFTNTSDPQTNSQWDFGDGTASTDVSPKHTFLTPGLKTVTLTATKIYANGGKCTAVTTRNIMILAAPVSTFATNAGTLNCGPFKLQVNAEASNLTNVAWDFGDAGGIGNTASGLVANYTYSKAGDYVVTATAYNAEGCTSVSTQIIKVTESPLADFTPSTQQFCGPAANVNFRNETTYSVAAAVNYKWFVDNNLVGTSKDLNYAFQVPLDATWPYIFKVKLRATNMQGCQTEMEKNVQFNPLPKAVFAVKQLKGCAPFKLEITNESVYVNQYEWYLDDVLVSKMKTPDDIILADFNKIYKLKLLVKNQYGCTESQQITQVSTHPYLKAAFTVAQDLSCNGLLNIQITNKSVGATSYTWDYGDDSPLYVGDSPSHSYGRPGTYNLKLLVSNGFCTDIFIKKVTVSEGPKAAFLSDVRNGCNQLTVKFTNTSVNATEYLWDFGDGTFSREENPTHNFIYAKTPYTVKLTVKNAVGCSDEVMAVNYVSVFPPPEADILISPNKVIKVPDYSFNFKAVNTENIIAYQWDFGDGQTSHKQEQTHKYDRFGTYKIKLHVTNINNCVNVIEDEVTVLDFPGYLFIPNAFEPENLNNDLKVFKVKASGMATYSMKIFNKWGQVIWQTTELDDQGVPTAYWDGTYKGQLLPQGAYFWQADATFINGLVWKGMKFGNKAESKNGVIHLIR